MMARPGRTAAVVGAVVAFAAVTLMGMLAGSAAASTPGTCTDNVNVRAEPTAGSRIVALCEAGTDVTTGAVRNGFVRIENLGGWAAEQYIAVDGATPNSTPRTAPSSSSSDDATTTAPPTTSPRSGSGSGSSDSTGSGSGTGGSGESGSTSRTGDDAGTTSQGGGTSSNSGDDADEDEDEDSGPAGGLLG
ncbi:hypothetical protein ACVGOW_16435 [Pseudonocardia saturnea]